MNTQRYALPEVEVSIENLGDAVRAILHSILLTRALGEVTPRAGKCKHYPTLGYAKCGDADVEVENLVERVKRESERKPVGPDLTRVDIIVAFFERREKTGLLGLVSSEERVYWEQWIVPLVVNTRPGADYEREEAGVRANMLRIVTLVNERSDHVPHSPSHPEAIFPFELKLSGDNDDGRGIANGPWSIARMLQQARPPL